METCAEGTPSSSCTGTPEHAVDPSPHRRAPRFAPRRSRVKRSSTEVRYASQPQDRRSSGACTGSDAHTVGIDAILNYKGYAGDKGLESYKCVRGLQPRTPRSTTRQLAERAAHSGPTRSSSARSSPSATATRRTPPRSSSSARKQGWRNKVVLLLGGPRIDHKLALELGFDAGFGPRDQAAADVASFLSGVDVRRPRQSRDDLRPLVEKAVSARWPPPIRRRVFERADRESGTSGRRRHWRAREGTTRWARSSRRG